MKKLIKRTDGSYSQRGLWDNIRANKGSGKEPTKEMLKQESKIKKEDMKSMYKKGGMKPSKKSVMNEAKREKESFLEESKEIGFGAPGVKAPKKKYATGGKEGDPLKATADSTAYYNNQAQKNYQQAMIASSKRDNAGQEYYLNLAKKSGENRDRQSHKGKPGYDANGYPVKKRDGGKSMAPGGGGRFAALVSKLKSKGKSTDQAKGIAAAVGRAKYGKSRFQAMAAAGRKKG